MCDNDGIDTTTAEGRHQLAAAVNDAHLEAELCSDCVKAALEVAKSRGKRLGAHNPKVKGRASKTQHERAMSKAKMLKSRLQKIRKEGLGRQHIIARLNSDHRAAAINGKAFTLANTQRILQRLSM